MSEKRIKIRFIVVLSEETAIPAVTRTSNLHAVTSIYVKQAGFNLNVLRESCRGRKMSRNFHTHHKTMNLYTGFGDAVNCEDTWKACSAYIDEQFRQYFTDESGLNRKNIQDNRVHCCLYFIPPYGHGYIRASIYI